MKCVFSFLPKKQFPEISPQQAIFLPEGTIFPPECTLLKKAHFSLQAPLAPSCKKVFDSFSNLQQMACNDVSA